MKKPNLYLIRRLSPRKEKMKRKHVTCLIKIFTKIQFETNILYKY